MVKNLSDLYASVDAAAILQFIADRQEEHLHLDFKQAAGTPTRDDRKNLAKAISGFANADGGIIVWGVKTERVSGETADHATGISRIEPLSHFLPKLNEITGDAVNPLVDGVLHKPVEYGGPDGGFAVTLVPASDSGPHMAKLGEDRYYKRSGSRFAKMEHYEVQRMFGQGQRPVLRLNYRWGQHTVHVKGGPVLSAVPKVTLVLDNSGRGSARAPFVDVLYPSEDYTLTLATGMRTGPSGSLVKPIQVTQSRYRFIGFADFIIHPGVAYDLADLVSKQQIAQPLILECRLAAENYPLEVQRLRIEAEMI